MHHHGRGHRHQRQIVPRTKILKYCINGIHIKIYETRIDKICFADPHSTTGINALPVNHREFQFICKRLQIGQCKSIVFSRETFEQIVEIDAGTFGGDDRFCKAEPISQVIGNNIEDRHVVHSVQIICYTGQPIF